VTLRLRLLYALIAGGMGAFGQAPYDLPVLLLAAMAVAVWLFRDAARPWHAALVGWAFGAGYFMHTLQWIVSPFMVDVARHGWMAPFALVFLGAGLALFWGAAFWGARKLSPGSWPLILTWTAAEMLRAYIFTGFPWAMPAQALVGTQPGLLLALIGPYGLTLVMVATAVGLAQLRFHKFHMTYVALVAAMATLATMWSVPARQDLSDTPHTIRLIQPNAPQRDKWDPDMIPVFFNRQLDFSAAPPTNPEAPPDLILWSESAIPWALDLADSALAQIAIAGGTAPVALGVQRRRGTRYFNSLVVLDTQGAPRQTYDKHHLVPFGEYMPLGNFLTRFGITALAAQAGNGYSAGQGAQLVDFGALGKALPLICYEAVFAHDVNATPERPDFLIQITNDAWFGKAAGPKQHLAQARMRAIEQGLPLARSANTGISAMIDPYGRVRAQLPLNTAGYLDARLPKALPPTLYSRTGDLPLTLLLLLAILAVLCQRRFSPLRS